MKKTNPIKKIIIASIIVLLVINIPILLFFVGGCAVGYIRFQLHQSTNKESKNNLSSVW